MLPIIRKKKKTHARKDVFSFLITFDDLLYRDGPTSVLYHILCKVTLLENECNYPYLSIIKYGSIVTCIEDFRAPYFNKLKLCLNMGLCSFA